MRVPHAAHTLVRQVSEAKPRSKFETVGEVDGFGVIRTISFDKTTSKWLEPLLSEIGDPRIVALALSDKGHLEITFSPGRIADQRDRFPLAEAEVVSGN